VIVLSTGYAYDVDPGDRKTVMNWLEGGPDVGDNVLICDAGRLVNKSAQPERERSWILEPRGSPRRLLERPGAPSIDNGVYLLPAGVGRGLYAVFRIGPAGEICFCFFNRSGAA
jgi:hypothetical protein